MDHGHSKHALRFDEGVLIDWSPLLAWRMIVRGVVVGDRLIPRRQVVAKVIAVGRMWFKWTTAMPGDLFLDFPRNLIICVDGGLPRDRTVRVVSRQAMQYPLDRKVGLQATFALTPPEPSKYEWWQLERVREAG